MKSIFPILVSSVFLCVFSVFAWAEEGRFLSSDGINIYYTDSEKGKIPIILLHGFTMDHNMWLESNIQKELAVDYRAITIDFRGHGLSDKPMGVSKYGPKIGLDVIDLLDYLNLNEAHMVGYSMGAYMLGRLMTTHPKRILSATFCSGGFPIVSDEEKAFQETTAEHMEEEGAHVFASIARGWALDAVSENQIEDINVPLMSVFGSEELNEDTKSQIRLLEVPKSSRPVMIIEGADHDSEKATVLNSEFLAAVKGFIVENSAVP